MPAAATDQPASEWVTGCSPIHSRSVFFSLGLLDEQVLLGVGLTGGLRCLEVEAEPLLHA